MKIPLKGDFLVSIEAKHSLSPPPFKHIQSSKAKIRFLNIMKRMCFTFITFPISSQALWVCVFFFSLLVPTNENT
jgi:hypothetical protein